MFEIKSPSVSIGAALHLFNISKLSFNFSLSILSFFDIEKMFSLARIGKFFNRSFKLLSNKSCDFNCRVKNSSRSFEKIPNGSNDFKTLRIFSMRNKSIIKSIESSFVDTFKYPLGSMNSSIDKAINLSILFWKDIFIWSVIIWYKLFLDSIVSSIILSIDVGYDS